MHKKEPFALLLACFVAARAYAGDLHVLGHVRSHKLDILAEGGDAWCAPHLRLHMVLQPDSPDVANRTPLLAIMKKLAKPISIDCPTAQDTTRSVETGGQTLGSYQAAAANGWGFTAVAPTAPAVAAVVLASPAAPPPPPPSQAAAQFTPSPPQSGHAILPPESAPVGSGPLDVRDAKRAAIEFIKAVDAGDMTAARAVSVGDEAAYVRFQALCDRVRAEARLQASFDRRFKGGYQAEGFPEPTFWDATTAQLGENKTPMNEKTVSVVAVVAGKTETVNIKLNKASGTWKVVVADVDGLKDLSAEQPPAEFDPATFRSMMKLFQSDDAVTAANANDIAQGIDAGLYANGHEAAQAFTEDHDIMVAAAFATIVAESKADMATQLAKEANSSATPQEAASLRAFVQRFQAALYDGDLQTVRALTSPGSEAGALFLQAVVEYRTSLFNLDHAFRAAFASEIGEPTDPVKLIHDYYLTTFLQGPAKLSAPTDTVIPYSTLAKRYIFRTSSPFLTGFVALVKKIYFGEDLKWRELGLLNVPPFAPVLGNSAERHFEAGALDDNIHFVRNGDTWKVSFVRQSDWSARSNVLQIRYGLFNLFHICGAADAWDAVPMLKDATSAITNLAASIESGHFSEMKDVLAALDKLGDDVDAAMKQGAIARNKTSVDSFLSGTHDPITAENPMLGKWRDINDPGLEKYTGMAYNVQTESVSQSGGQNPAHFKVIAQNQVELFSSLPLTDLKAADGGQVCYFSDQNHMFCPNFNYRGSGYYVRLGTSKR